MYVLFYFHISFVNIFFIHNFDCWWPFSYIFFSTSVFKFLFFIYSLLVMVADDLYLFMMVVTNDFFKLFQFHFSSFKNYYCCSWSLITFYYFCLVLFLAFNFASESSVIFSFYIHLFNVPNHILFSLVSWIFFVFCTLFYSFILLTLLSLSFNILTVSKLFHLN